MASTFQLCVCVCVILVTQAAAVYVFNGDPYSPSSLLPNGALTFNKSDGIPQHTQVVYPTVPGMYTPIVFIGGFFGAMVTEWYSTVTAKFAGYGYVVAGVDPLWPVLTGMEDNERWSWKYEQEPRGKSQRRVASEADTVFAVIEWLKENLNQHFLPTGVAVDWEKLGLLSHSAGGEVLVWMLTERSDFAKAVAFLEPLIFNGTLGYSIPALAYGTQFCTDFPNCCIRGIDYISLYPELQCPKILMNVTGYGHCDILDEVHWKECNFVHFCKTDKTNNRDLYREKFVPGVLASFFGTYLQGNSDIIKYLTTPDDMPVPLGELKYDLNC